MKKMSADQARLRPHLRAAQKPKDDYTGKPRKVATTDELQAAGVKVLGKNRGRLLAPPIRIPHTFPTTTRAQLLDAAQRKCYLCGCDLTLATLEVEHIIPVAKGGTHTRANLAPACGPCNSRKGSRYVAFMVSSRKPIYLPSWPSAVRTPWLHSTPGLAPPDPAPKGRRS